MIYIGYKATLNQSAVDVGKYYPMEWEKQLDWSAGPQVIPSPYKEITWPEWLLRSECNHEAQRESFSVGMNIPGEYAWFGGWSGHLITYHTYGLLSVHMNFSPNSPAHITKPEVSLGVVLVRDQYTHYVVRFFELGCQHEWQQLPGYMFEHNSVCTKCGQKVSYDSSG